ncbi:MAG: tRNA (adenosine(37)-N6)-threonylcarbamoyltransferase complex transferase subunit TsaD [Sphingobacteriia bacterium]|nr:tRNA (adenosine(37)-N6)-threonylcarbamoyltransferase complex transferase subunit TsaD [Sphingobacteriia bacterium]
MYILGIETSCDETSIAIVDNNKNILSHKILSQIEEHTPFGGVVPEIAARAHINYLPNLIKEALSEAQIDISKIDGIAVTSGPGLIGGLLVGLMTAKGIAASLNKPLIAVNHLEGHALTIRLTDKIEFPYLLLLVSGGHCQILIVHGVGSYTKLGSTIDDAVGEAYDKVAKMLQLGYPGGPAVEKAALKGNKHAYVFPKSMVGRDNCDFSFSGLKTAVKRTLDKIDNLNEQIIVDLCASFQFTVGEILKDRISNAIKLVKQNNIIIENLVIAGGVAANKYIISCLKEITDSNNLTIKSPPIKLCTDNGAMIAWVGVERMSLGFTNDLVTEPKATWPLM